LEKASSKLIVGNCKVLVDLDSVLKLNGCLRVLSLFQVLHSAIKVPLHPNLGVTQTTSH